MLKGKIELGVGKGVGLLVCIINNIIIIIIILITPDGVNSNEMTLK